MANDYNANLIAELYTTSGAEKATHICDEMVEIGDPIFPRQIYEAYKRFKGSRFSHYFISDLTRFNTIDAAEILKEIAHTTNDDADISMMIEYLGDIEYFPPDIVYKVKKIFQKEIISKEVNVYDLEIYLSYLEKSGQGMEDLVLFLKICFENDDYPIPARKMALKKLLKLKPKEYINAYYEDYDLIKGKKLEVIFVEEISTWHGGVIPSLHKKILEVGSDRAKEILEKKLSKKLEEKKQEEKREQKEIKEEYETADVVSDIAKLRSKINKITTVDERFGFPIFAQSEEIYQQGKPAKDKDTLVGYCMVLRSSLQDFDNKITQLDISPERAGELLPNIRELNGSINKFHFILVDKGISVDAGIFGLRNINRIVTKLAHPKEESGQEFLDILKEENLLDFYREDNWSLLHRGILLRYRGVLEKIIEAVSNK